MKEKKYIIWSDGVLTSMGVLVSHDPLLGNCYTVENPVSIVFATEQVPVEGDPMKVKSVLRFDMTPFVFGACFNEGKSVWNVRPAHVVLEGTPSDKLIDSYNHTIRVTSPVNSGVVGES